MLLGFSLLLFLFVFFLLFFGLLQLCVFRFKHLLQGIRINGLVLNLFLFNRFWRHDFFLGLWRWWLDFGWFFCRDFFLFGHFFHWLGLDVRFRHLGLWLVDGFFVRLGLRLHFGVVSDVGNINLDGFNGLNFEGLGCGYAKQRHQQDEGVKRYGSKGALLHCIRA